jgi:hypothetical protein
MMILAASISNAEAFEDGMSGREFLADAGPRH